MSGRRTTVKTAGEEELLLAMFSNADTENTSSVGRRAAFVPVDSLNADVRADIPVHCGQKVGGGGCSLTVTDTQEVTKTVQTVRLINHRLACCETYCK